MAFASRYGIVPKRIMANLNSIDARIEELKVMRRIYTKSNQEENYNKI